MRSVIPGMERLSSLVRLGPSCRRQRIVPFQTAIHHAHHRVHRTLGDFFFADWHFSPYTNKYDSTLTSDSMHNRLGVMEHFTSNKHLPRLFAQALNEKRIELFDEFIHPEYNNHNPQVQPGPAGVQAFFRHYLDAFPDTKVVIQDVIEENDRISARFTYDGTLRKPFVGYRPNSAPVQLRSIDIWRVKDGKFVEHWDELNLLEVLQQIGAATVRKSDGQ
jgi:predicted SnoaL-like aldol condensation-catalyzing enzyme